MINEIGLDSSGSKCFFKLVDMPSSPNLDLDLRPSIL